MKTEPNQLAFPCDETVAEAGLTKREYMCIEFTKAFIARGNKIETSVEFGIRTANQLIRELNEERL